jgi:glycosyltransferase 2 family protein
MNNETHHHLLRGWRFRALIIVVCLSAAGYLLFTIWGGWENVIEAISQVGVLGITVALMLSLTNYGFRFVRWQHYLAVLGHKIPWLINLRLFLSGFALTATPAKAGEALRGIFLKDFGVSYHTSFGAFFSERISDLISVLILGTIGLWIYPDARLVIVAVGFFMGAFLFLLQNHAWLLYIEKWFQKHFSERVGNLIKFFIEIILAVRSCYALPTFLFATLLGILAWGAEGTAFFYLLKLLKSDISIFTALFIYAFSMLIGAISFLPGGLGGVEVTMLQLLIWHGIPPPIAVAATIVIRLATLWFSILIGILVLPKNQLTIVNPPEIKN